MNGCNCYGEKLIAVGAALSFQISQQTTLNELAILGAFFTVIGDQLALLATTRQACLDSMERAEEGQKAKSAQAEKEKKDFSPQSQKADCVDSTQNPVVESNSVRKGTILGKESSLK